MQRIIAAALVAAATPLAAGAGTCPTNDDLEIGIRLTRLEPSYFAIIYRQDRSVMEYAVFARDLPPILSATYSHPLAEISIGWLIFIYRSMFAGSR